MTESARLGLPFIEAGQAQKEWTHNEALALLDMAAQATVEGIADAPPPNPVAGACWIVGTGPTGAWAGRAGAMAGWTAGGWRFLSPREGMTAWHAGQAALVRYRTGNWVTERGPAIAAPTGGAVTDGECRAAVTAILQALQVRGLIA